MRSNYQHIEQIRQEIKSITLFLRKAKVLITVGLEGRQWLASALICAMLSPVISLPVRAAGFTVQGNAEQFEPVNEQLPVWKQAWRNLNVGLEFWSAYLGNKLVFDDDEKDIEKKNSADKKKKGRKSVASEEKEMKPNARRAAPETESAVVLPEEEKKNLKTEDAKSEEKPVPAGKNSAAPVNIKNKTPQSAPVRAFNQLPLDERDSIYTVENNLGSPYGQSELDSTNEASALRIRHRAGIANFNFEIPIASLSGRGINAGVALNYNSRAWNKSATVNQNNTLVPHFTYDVDQSWIAPGFTTGFGYLETAAQTRNIIYNAPHNSWHTEIQPLGLTDPDGTRHQLVCKSSSTIPGTSGYQTRCNVYATSDGTLIEFAAKPWIANPNNSWTPYTGTYHQISFATVYPDGSRVWYSGAFGSGLNRRHYPLIIQDRNGNRLRIVYQSDQSGRIDYIRDTLNRDIKFHYGTDPNNNSNKLVAITIPGMGTNEEIQAVRFYYETMSLETDGFVSDAVVTAPPTISVLKYVYMPDTKTGYKYEYHQKYGMIKKITRLYGMQGSTNATDTTGTVTEGIWAAKTEYDYPDGSTPQEDVPKYT
ncbi:MAG TPA: hypothetical protein VF599_04455, partial [Pyrinomonadaceae bacterium]